MKTLIPLLLFAFLFVTVSLNVYGQADALSHTLVPGQYVGWDNTGVTPAPLEIRSDFTSAQPIDFYINNIHFLSIITGVNLGDLTLVQPTNAYEIGDPNASTPTNNRVLWHNGFTEDIFVGVDAGNATMIGHDNTYVGNMAGNMTSDGAENTCVGNGAGTGIQEGDWNTYVGYDAGLRNKEGYGNTGVGYQALLNTHAYGGCAFGYNTASSNTRGCSIVAIGENALYSNVSGDRNNALGFNALTGNQGLSDNVAIGSYALASQGSAYSDTDNVASSYNVAVGNAALAFNNGTNNNEGIENTAIGYLAGGGNVTGNTNSFLGYLADVAQPNLRNVTAVGANTFVPDDNQMILGDMDVNVGIGLSGDNMTASGLVYEGPGNKLEINAGMYPSGSAPYGYGVPGIGDHGWSGLRLRDLTDHCATEVNQGIGVLAVNSNGDVIYVPKEGLGNYCAAHPNPILANYEIPLNGFDYFFSGQHDLSTNVIVGQTCPDVFPHAKFQSFQLTTQTSPSGESDAGLFINGTNNKIAIGATGMAPISQYLNIGLKGIVREYRGASNLGVLGTVNNAAALLAGNMNVGVYGYAKMRPAPISTHLNLAVVGDLGVAIPPCGGLLCTGGDFAGYFNGDVLSTTGIFAVSDATLKENIETITDPMNILNSLVPKSYTFKQSENESMLLPQGVHYGILAQEMENVLPTAVKHCVHAARYDDMGNQTHSEIDYLAVNNMELIPFLVAAVKEQQQTIEGLQAQLTLLNGGGQMHGNPVDEEGNDDGNTSAIDVELKNAKTIILNVAVPNPFKESTTISYFIPDDVNKAQIIFYDNTGTVLKTVDILEKGAGQINVYAPDLSSGVYSYSLITDGQLFETKKMVKQN